MKPELPHGELPLQSTEFPGDYCEREPPDPIPNSEVKTLSADGSVAVGHVRVGRRQGPNPKPRSASKLDGALSSRGQPCRLGAPSGQVQVASLSGAGRAASRGVGWVLPVQGTQAFPPGASSQSSSHHEILRHTVDERTKRCILVGPSHCGCESCPATRSLTSWQVICVGTRIQAPWRH